ncbi:MAG: hypothetical protein JXO22_07590 [Phycisphaerae bacterium]|nr:hypothetical protein [Phycisphaerae bacterium]
MDREAFEQLVSDWLDEPTRDNLRQAVDAAVAGSAELRALRDQYVRVHELTLGVMRVPESVDWNSFRGKVAASAISDATDQSQAPLDQALERLPDVTRKVDWERFQQRTSARIVGGGARSESRRRNWRLVLALGSVGVAAALLVFVFNLPSTPSPQPSAPRGNARALIMPVGGAVVSSHGGVALATVTVLPGETPMDSTATAVPSDSIVFVFTAPPSRPQTTSDPDLVGFY